MKKITLLLFCSILNLTVFSQNDCSSALEVTAGSTTTVGMIDGTYESGCWIIPGSSGEFYKYTATIDGIITITSDLSQNAGADTRLSVFTGDCAALTCYSQSDDTDANFLTTLRFAAFTGRTYFIQWDDRWDDSGFDFILTESTVDCGDSNLPFMDDFSDEDRFIVCWQNIDDDNDGESWGIIDYDLDDDDNPDGDPCLVSASWAGAPLTPDNWLISNGIDLSAYNASDNINLTWQARAIDPLFANENYSVYAATGDQIADFLGSSVNFNEIIGQNGGAGATFVDRSLDVSSLAGNMIYIAFRHHDTSDEFTLNIDNVGVDLTLGENVFNLNQFNHTYDKNIDVLTIKSSNLLFDQVEIYSLLGQNVYSKSLSTQEERLNLSTLKDGIYLVNVKAGGSAKTIKLIKH